MAKLSGIVAELKKERDRAQLEIRQLDAALRALGSLNGSFSGVQIGTKRHKMSAAGRKSIAAAQRARWAKWKAKRQK